MSAEKHRESIMQVNAAYIVAPDADADDLREDAMLFLSFAKSSLFPLLESANSDALYAVHQWIVMASNAFIAASRAESRAVA